MNPFETRVTKDNTLVVTFDEVTSGWEQWILVTSDRHWDSTDSDRAMQKRHLEEAKERNALVVDLGDLFDAMQGRNDKRGAKSAVRPELQRSDYFSALVESAVDWFGPYAPHFLMLGTGNHETSIMRHNEINLTWHLGRQLNAEHGGNIHLGNYSGWLRFQFKSGRKRTYWPAIVAHYHHGSGGSSPVTKGVIQTNRRATYLPDANVVLSGHIHQTWLMPIERERLSDAGTVFLDTQMHVSVPPYKRPSRRSGWEIEKGMAPSGKGAIWWRLYYLSDSVRSEFTWAQ
jgi:hypothetical protein